jgi:hypothetical protein
MRRQKETREQKALHLRMKVAFAQLAVRDAIRRQRLAEQMLKAFLKRVLKAPGSKK